MADDTNTAEREAFEAWAKGCGYQSDELARCKLGFVSPAYFNLNTENAWKAWQARASLAASAGSEKTMDGEIALIEKAVKRVGIKSLLNHGAGSLVYSEGVEGVTQDDLLAYTREIALHCAVALGYPPEGMVAVPKDFIRAFSDTAHNYQLSVDPPDHFSGTEGDAFRAAYARCGVELLRLRGILIGPIPASEAKEL